MGIAFDGTREGEGREGEAIISRESERSIKIFLQSKGLRDDGAAAHEYIFA